LNTEGPHNNLPPLSRNHADENQQSRILDRIDGMNRMERRSSGHHQMVRFPN